MSANRKGLYYPVLKPRLAQLSKSEQQAFWILHAVLTKLQITSLDGIETRCSDSKNNGTSIAHGRVFAYCNIFIGKRKQCIHLYDRGGHQLLSGCLDESTLNDAIRNCIRAAEQETGYKWDVSDLVLQTSIAESSEEYVAGRLAILEPSRSSSTPCSEDAQPQSSPVKDRRSLLSVIAAFYAIPNILDQTNSNAIYNLTKQLKSDAASIQELFGRLSMARNPLDVLSPGELQLLGDDDKTRLGISDIDLLSEGAEALKNDNADYWTQRVAKFETTNDTTHAILVIPRRGQQLFRAMILANYGHTCCISGLRIAELLEASHIVGWAESAKDRLNPRNGLCLAPSLHAAFDQGLLTVIADGIVYVRKSVRNHEQRIRSENDTLSRWHGRRIIQPSRAEHTPDPVLLAKHHERFGLTDEIKSAKL